MIAHTENGDLAQRFPVRTVQLTDGQALAADLVVVAIGSQPCTDWLGDSGLVIDDGVV